MKKFEFSLQNLLDLRTKQLEEKQIEFGKLQFIMRKLENELADFTEELLCSKHNFENLLTAVDGISVDLVNANNRHILLKENEIVEQKHKIENHKLTLEEKQREMIEALKAKTMLDKLKEKQYKTFLKELDATERKELDEIGLARYAR